MEIVLLENIKNLGNIGDVVNVKRGHGTNFLIKYGKALKASKENIEIVNKKKAELNEKNATLKKNAKKINDVIIALDQPNPERIMSAISKSNGSPISIKILPDMYEVVTGLARTNQLVGVPLIDINLN